MQREKSLLDWMRTILALRVRGTHRELCGRTGHSYSSNAARVRDLRRWGLAREAGKVMGDTRYMRMWVLTREGRTLADAIESLPVMKEHVLPSGAAA